DDRAQLVDGLTAGLCLQQRVVQGVEFVIAGARGLIPGFGIRYRELQAWMPFAEIDAESPGCEIALVEILGFVIDRLATPVGPADARAIPQIHRIALAQKDALEAFAAVPAVLPHLGAGAVPHDQSDL